VASFTKIKMWFFELVKLDLYISEHFPKRSKLEIWFLVSTIFLLFFLGFQGKFFPEIFDVHPYVIIFLEVLLSLYVIYRCWVCYFILDTITKPDFVCFETLRFDFNQFVCFTKFVVVIKGAGRLAAAGVLTNVVADNINLNREVRELKGQVIVLKAEVSDLNGKIQYQKSKKWYW
jgi:hypothetical protein